jgi:hypothetical protein
MPFMVSQLVSTVAIQLPQDDTLKMDREGVFLAAPLPSPKTFSTFDVSTASFWVRCTGS